MVYFFPFFFSQFFFCQLCSYSPRAAKGIPSVAHLPLAPKPCSSLLDMYPCIFQILYTLGPYIHSEPILLAKVVRLGRMVIKERFSSKSSDDHLQEKVSISVQPQVWWRSIPGLVQVQLQVWWRSSPRSVVSLAPGLVLV